ncbi:MAG: phosphoribosylformylglycinamidine cyclo-ligase [Candidatus Omnitrophota bacterium]
MKNKITYKNSGVDIQKANRFVASIERMIAGTQASAVLKRKGSFGSLFAFDNKKYREPVLVSSADGVGTKLMIANLAGKHDTVGIDCVAMNVNDILCCGAKPLFFLDYVACGKIHPKVLKDVLKGIVWGCQQAGCSLIGGETAEMPGIYKKEDYDLAGFTVGVVEKSRMIDGSKIQAGDRLIGLASNGLHSNGFSLVRKILSKKQQKTMAQELLRPTKIYVQPVLGLLTEFSIRGMAHITGGAFYEKLTKIIPQGLCCAIDQGSWPVPKIFEMLRAQGCLSTREMFTTFNMGIGMVLVVRPKDSESVRRYLQKQKIQSWDIGEVVKNRQGKIKL